MKVRLQTMKYNFPIERTGRPKAKPDPNTLKFGAEFADHMFLMEHTKEEGWHDGKVMAYGHICLEPAAAVFHYAQECFEGLKAYKSKDGRVLLFRPGMNAKRLNVSAVRLCMPPVDEELFVEAIKTLVRTDKDWIPEKEGTSLYIRPFIAATEPFLGVRAAEQFMFVIILCPVGPYYEGGLSPTRLLVEDEYVRAALGGTGFTKAGGNYGAALKAQEKAHSHGCEQVLWLDTAERRYVEEIGTSNAFFVFGDEIITPPAGGTILPGVTRDSIIALLKKWGNKVTERRISIDEVLEGVKTGTLSEMFATGTAAVISPVGELIWKGEKTVIGGGSIGGLAQKLYDELYGIQTGEVEDHMGWTVEVE